MKIICAFKKPPEGQDFDKVKLEEFPENQRGIWNQNIVTWFIKGDTRDNAFVDREAFLKRLINISWTEWDIEIPPVFIQAESEAEADVLIEFGARADDRYYKDSPTVLAYAGFPDGSLKGYMKIITDWNWNAHGQTGFNIIIVIIHELGHILGLPHSQRRLGKDMMDPWYNKNLLDISPFDVIRINDAYGVRVYDEPTHYERLEKANSLSKERIKNEEIAKS